MGDTSGKERKKERERERNDETDLLTTLALLASKVSISKVNAARRLGVNSEQGR